MEAHMHLGNYLVAYLRKIGLTHLFGIPGDLVIQLFMKFGNPRIYKSLRLRMSQVRGSPWMAIAGYRENRRPVCDLRGWGAQRREHRCRLIFRAGAGSGHQRWAG